jgi:2-polyprenyl-6-hydroxyphenyl methylase/3-demethylubiquinone-9 3-methyltransferase
MSPTRPPSWPRWPTLAEGGLMVLSTPNRTPASRLLMVEAAERLGMVPRGTHHWDDFVTPLELHDLLEAAGLKMGNPKGIAWSPPRGCTCRTTWRSTTS